MKPDLTEVAGFTFPVPQPVGSDPTQPQPMYEAEIEVKIFEAGELAYTINLGRAHLNPNSLNIRVLEDEEREFDGDRVVNIPARYVSLNLQPSMVASRYQAVSMTQEPK